MNTDNNKSEGFQVSDVEKAKMDKKTAKRYGITPQEFNDMIASMSEAELKDFQIKDCQHEIKTSRVYCLHFAIISILLLLSSIGAYNTLGVWYFVPTLIVCISFALASISRYNQLKGEVMSYRMLLMFFEQNGI